MNLIISVKSGRDFVLDWSMGLLKLSMQDAGQCLNSETAACNLSIGGPAF